MLPYPQLGRRAFDGQEDGVMTEKNDKLRRSENKVIAGVCGGLAERIGWPARRLRVVYVLLSILSAAFPGTIVYLVLWFVMPGPEE
jgi:phage shock protein PspC (stress-responsive transcriptional regulator)